VSGRSLLGIEAKHALTATIPELDDTIAIGVEHRVGRVLDNAKSERGQRTHRETDIVGHDGRTSADMPNARRKSFGRSAMLATVC